MKLLLNPSASFSINSEKECLIYVNNSRFIFKHSRAKEIIAAVFKSFTSPMGQENFASQLGDKYNSTQLSKLIEEFMKLKLLIQTQSTHPDRLNYAEKYGAGPTVSMNFFKNIFLLSDELDTTNLLESISSFYAGIKAANLSHGLPSEDYKDSMVIVVTGANEFFKILQLNKLLKEQNIPWLWIEALDSQIKIGPLFNCQTQSQNSFCLNCYYLRKMGRAVDPDSELKFSSINNYSEPVRSIKLNPLFTEIICVEVQKILMNPDRITFNDGYQSYDFENNDFHFAYLTKSSVCDVCFPSTSPTLC